MNIVGPPLGKLAIIPPSLPQANFNQAAVLIRPYLHKDNINVYLKAYLEEMSEITAYFSAYALAWKAHLLSQETVVQDRTDKSNVKK